MENINRKIVDTQNRILSSEGWRITKKIDILQVSYSIFMGNYNELNNALFVYQNNEKLVLQLMRRENSNLLDDFLKEIIRLFHNYLAAVKTLVDHTRVFAQEEYKGTDFWEEYDKAIGKHFRDVPIVRFIQELRNYTLHKTLPLTSAEVRWGKDKKMTSSIKLEIDTLRDWDKWSSKARECLNDMKDNENLIDIIENYKSIVETFYQWFSEKQKIIHYVSLEELWKLQEEQFENYKQAGYKL